MTFKDKNQKDKSPIDGKLRDSSVSREIDHNARVPMYKQKTTDVYGFLEPGYRYRIVNDVPGRIHNFMRAGWMIAEVDIASSYSDQNHEKKPQSGSGAWRTVNDGKDAPCYDGVLMRIPLELWEQDQAAKAVEREITLNDVDPTGQVKKAMNMAVRANSHLTVDAFKK